jgi:hypothetical protein
MVAAPGYPQQGGFDKNKLEHTSNPLENPHNENPMIMGSAILDNDSTNEQF